MQKLIDTLEECKKLFDSVTFGNGIKGMRMISQEDYTKLCQINSRIHYAQMKLKNPSTLEPLKV